MSHPPVQFRFGKPVAAALLVLGLAFLVGCQGISAGNSGPQGGTLGFASNSMNFGSVAAGTSKTLTLTATNSAAQTVNINSVAVTSKYFSLVGPSLPLSIAAGDSATLTLKFTPSAAGAFNGTVSVTSDASNAVTNISVTGTGTADGELGLSGASGVFGSVAVGGVGSQTVTLTNNGAANVDISQATVGGNGFQLSGLSTPLTLAPTQSTTFTLVFAPSAIGSISGTLTIASDASNAALTMQLSGVGVAAGSLGSNPTYLGFGGVQVGSKETLSESVTNSSATSVTISQISVSGAGFSESGITAPLTLAAGQTANYTITFAPTTAGAVSGYITITSTAPNPILYISMDGQGTTTAGSLGASPSSLGFGTVQVGSTQTLSETVTNNGGANVTVSQIAASGAGYSVSGISLPITLATGQSANFSVSFAPTSAGAVSGNVAVTSNASNATLSIPLSGTGAATGALGSNPASLNFGSVQVGNKQTLSETVTNTGGSSVTISQIAASGSGFSVSGITAPVTLTSGQSASFSVSFTPTTAGATSGNVAITSNASNATLNVPLSGTGTAAGAMTSNPTSLGFGSLQVGNTQTLSETVTNTGGSSVTISQVAASGTGFSVSGIAAPVTLTSGQSASFSVSFAPTTAGAVSGSVTITSNASNPTLTVPVSGTGVTAGTLGSNPASLSFSSVQLGNTQTLAETVTNAGGSSVTISQVAASGTGFSVSGIAVPMTLASGRSASFSVSFAPATVGAATGSVTVTSNASNPTLTIPLSGKGTAVGQLGVTPTTLGIGSVVVGTSGNATASLTATGASVTVTGVGSSNSAFSLSGLTLPVTIPAGQSVQFTVTFSPQTTGAASGTLTFNSDGQPSTTVELLTGTGTAAPAHSVNLGWDASSSPNISGYNIYRAVFAGSCGSYSRINPSLNASTAYTDSDVTDGTAYCYATTAVNSSDEESGYSNIVSGVQIPAP